MRKKVFCDWMAVLNFYDLVNWWKIQVQEGKVQSSFNHLDLLFGTILQSDGSTNCGNQLPQLIGEDF